MISLMSGGMYHSLWELFTADELITVGTFIAMLWYVYMEAQIKQLKDKKIERKFREQALKNMQRSITDVRNVNTSKLFI